MVEMYWAVVVPFRLGNSPFYISEFWKLDVCHELRADG